MKIDFIDYKTLTPDLISQHKSFEICGVALRDMLDVCQYLEEIIEEQYLKSRIYTKNRLVACLIALFNFRWGMLFFTSIIAHNIITLNPDYEIIRDLANNRIEVVWKN